MGNQIQKEFNIKQKPLKLPGSYSFLRFIHHPSEDLSLIIVKAPHRATPISSTLILPIKEIRQLSGSSDSVAICFKCLPLALVKPKSQTQMRILMHKILKSSTEIGRCFFYSGRIMLWCEQKRGIGSSSPEEVDSGKSHEKSKVFISGISLINFLYCVYESEISVKKEGKAGKKDLKSIGNSLKDRINEKLREKSVVNQSLPQEIKLFFQPKDKKEFYQMLYTMETRLNQTTFWQNISQGLRELLLNMISEDPEKRIDLEVILNIPYFMESNQLRLYSALADDLEGMSPREAKIFMASLELIIKEGLTIELCLMEDYFRPVLCSMVTYNYWEGKENDHLIALTLSILIELDKPPVDIIYHGFKKAHAKNSPLLRLVLTKKGKLLQLLPTEYFDSVLSRAIFGSFESQSLIEYAILCIPFAMKNIKHANYRKEIEFLLISRVLAFPLSKIKESLLLDGLKCMIFLVRENLLTSYAKLESIIYEPLKLSIEANFHVLYLYGLMIESFQPLELLDKMMPKLQLFLNELEIYDEIFVVAKRCVDRILERLYQQRKIDPQSMAELQKEQHYFDMREDPSLAYSAEDTRTVLKKQIEKHEMQNLRWTISLL